LNCVANVANSWSGEGAVAVLNELDELDELDDPPEPNLLESSGAVAVGGFALARFAASRSARTFAL
jgi:hypothetical protein